MRLGARYGCHQLPARSFFYKDYQFPVCARCTGAAAGECGVFLLYVLFGYVLPAPIALALACIMLFDWTAQQIDRYQGTNLSRFCTGIAGGFGCWSLGLAFVLWAGEQVGHLLAAIL